MHHTLNDILNARLSRRNMLGGVLATSAAFYIPKIQAETPTQPNELPHESKPLPRAAHPYQLHRIIAWGDPLFAENEMLGKGLEDVNITLKQFGYNNDFNAVFPINHDEWLLATNHESPNAERMFGRVKITHKQAQIVLASLGITISHWRRNNKVVAGCELVRNSNYTRRLTPFATMFELTGAVAGHPRVQTKQDTSGTKVIGTLGNCSGGITPWQTMLSAEENIDIFFNGNTQGKEAENHHVMGIEDKSENAYLAKYDARFDVTKEPNEPNRFGYVVEVNPKDPASVPKKRSALGRFKHECATVAINPDGRIVVYTGDDEIFQHLYKYVSNGSYQPNGNNEKLLDEGTLFVARFTEENVEWLPLIYGYGKLNEQNGFSSQADVLIETRKAAKLLGATPMDRPEDIEIEPGTGHVYISLTNNRMRETANSANPRFPNQHGHIIKLIPPQRGGKTYHAAQIARWDPFILAGNPYDPVDAAHYPQKPSEHGWFSCPDNLLFAPDGTLYICTDGQAKTIPADDAMYRIAMKGKEAGKPVQIISAQSGAEITGPAMLPTGSILFSMQHPDSALPNEAIARPSLWIATS
jgi:uncharacterized protein